MEKPINYNLKYGLQYGVVLILFSLLKYIFRLEAESVLTSVLLSITNFSITIIALSLAISLYRKNILDGYIKYVQAVSFGMGVMFIAAFVSAFVAFIYFQWIDTFYLSWRTTAVKEMILDFYYSINLPQESIDMVENMLSKGKTPSAFSAAWAQMMGDMFRGFIVALIVSIFLKKDLPLFDKNKEV